MARVRITLDGRAENLGSPLLLHSDRLADPLNPYTRWLSELTGKRKKTEADQQEIGRREFLGSGYWLVDEGPGGKVSTPVMPAWNVVRCIQEGAKMFKLGQQVQRGLLPIDEFLPIIYDGPKDAAELWKDSTFYLRKGVKISGRMTSRTRPCFIDWQIEGDFELDLKMLEVSQLDDLVKVAGRYQGIGDYRQRFGHFAGEVVMLGEDVDFAAADALNRLREQTATRSARKAIEDDDAETKKTHPNGKARRDRVAKVLTGK